MAFQGIIIYFILIGPGLLIGIQGYRSVICEPAHPQTNQRAAPEMGTLSESTHCMLENDVDRCGDVAMQLHKALEIPSADNSWETAQELQAVERHDAYSASREEQYRGSRRRLQEVRLHHALTNLQAKVGGPAVADR